MSGLAAALIRALVASDATLAAAESLTGGLVTAELVGVPGASAVVRAGIVAYATPIKASLLGVDPALLHQHGAVHPDVALQMAIGVRRAAAIDGRPATWGVSTTGVAGPDPQDGQPVGTVYVGIASAQAAAAFGLQLVGDRSAIRTATVSELLMRLHRAVTGVEYGE
ncbi:CinA family protein [Curtobacterium ammoniigenes]|uniref:CinA family protein n=1 Tax=Curtobacterium ammoniigenes TaxID=395387 RepID=UPI000830CC7F|nr:nicotinamide-nucleotide amidohydrolase family protein [Curtobacterium ammoniigenes]